MDRQAWIAITLCIIGLIVWQVYMAKHPPPPLPARVTPSPSPIAVSTATPTISPPAPNVFQPNEPVATPTPAPFAERTATLRNADLELRLTNRGGGIAEAVLPKHTAENARLVKLNLPGRMPIGAILRQPNEPLFEEFSILPAAPGSVQFERACVVDSVRARRRRRCPAGIDPVVHA